MAGFDPTSPQALADPVKRVLLAVLDIIGGDAPWDSEVLYQVISDAMAPKSDLDRALLGGRGPITYEQLAGLVSRAQGGWKSRWLSEHVNTSSTLLRFGVDPGQAPSQAVETLLERWTEQPGSVFLRLPARTYENPDFVTISTPAGAYTITREALDAARVKGVRGK